MELALYHPEHGYYRVPREVFGAGGDFYTAEQLQPVFGELLTTFIASVERSHFAKGPFEVLELGAGRGELRSALARWNYRGFDWRGDSLPQSISGLVLANEFFDALPVDLLRRADEGWEELGVVVREGSFSYAGAGPPSARLLAYAEQFGGALPVGGLLEICLWRRRMDGANSSDACIRVPAGDRLRLHGA